MPQRRSSDEEGDAELSTPLEKHERAAGQRRQEICRQTGKFRGSRFVVDRLTDAVQSRWVCPISDGPRFCSWVYAESEGRHRGRARGRTAVWGLLPTMGAWLRLLVEAFGCERVLPVFFRAHQPKSRARKASFSVDEYRSVYFL